MSTYKAWDWSKEKDQIWLEPSEECHYIAARWRTAGYQNLLDFGCGLGRHSIFFAAQGFSVSAFDLSDYGTTHLKDWAEREKLNIDVRLADMQTLPYPDKMFDCLFAFHVIYHTDTAGMTRILQEIRRVTRPGGEIYLTLGSKESWSYKEAGYPRADENTVIKTAEGPETGVPHFYVDLDDAIRLFDRAGIELLRVRHTDDCYYNGQKQDGKHYFALARRNAV